MRGADSTIERPKCPLAHGHERDLNSPVKLLLFPGSATHGRAPFWCQAGEMPTVPDKLHRLC